MTTEERFKPQPWQDTPRCLYCDSSSTVPRAYVDFDHRASPGDRIVCVACGRGWVGSDIELGRALRAQEAWEAEKARARKETLYPRLGAAPRLVGEGG